MTSNEIPTFSQYQPARRMWRRVLSRPKIVLGLCAISAIVYVFSLGALVENTTDAMREGSRATLGWDYLVGPRWPLGWFPLMIWMASAIWVVRLQSNGSPILCDLLRVPRISMAILCVSAYALPALIALSGAFTWSGPEFKSGLCLW